MNLSELLQLPPSMQLAVLVLLWPAIWAGALMSLALAADATRLATKPRATRQLTGRRQPAGTGRGGSLQDFKF